MSYVLVSLVRDEDDATRVSDAFAHWYAEQHRPEERFHGDSPDHEKIARAVRGLNERRGFVLGHGGESLRSSSDADRVWANARQFGTMFRDARVYVFACSTLSEDPTAQSFGKQAVGQGVRAYAGHFMTIEAPDIRDTSRFDMKLRRAVERVVRMFLEGCNDPAQLRMEARSVLSSNARIQLKPMKEPSWSWSVNKERIFGSLKVEIREG